MIVTTHRQELLEGLIEAAETTDTARALVVCRAIHEGDLSAAKAITDEQAQRYRGAKRRVWARIAGIIHTIDDRGDMG